MTPPRKSARPEARRLLAADLFAKGKSYIEVARILVVSEEAARKWRVRWDAGGRAALKEQRVGKRGPRAPMTDAQAKALMVEAGKRGVQTMTAISSSPSDARCRARGPRSGASSSPWAAGRPAPPTEPPPVSPAGRSAAHRLPRGVPGKRASPALPGGPPRLSTPHL